MAAGGLTAVVVHVATAQPTSRTWPSASPRATSAVLFTPGVVPPMTPGPPAHATPPAPAPASALVHICGARLCLGTAPWQLDGASVYAGYRDPASTVALARAGQL